jgi:citronellyl-CoA dehydrogenase
VSYNRYFTQEHNIFRQQLRAFVERELAPHADEWEKTGFPNEVFKKLGALGYLGLRYPESVGGAGVDYWYTVIFHEELIRCNTGGVAMGVGVQTDMCTPAINLHGTPEQQAEFLTPVIKGEKIGAIAVTEPGAGSDVKAIRTRAVKDGDDYVINGAKTFITMGARADFLTLAVKTDPDGGYGGISLFLFPTATPGFTVTRELDKFGMHSADTCELAFEDCRINKRYLLGEENKGFYYIMEGFQFERMVAVIASLSGAQMCLERTIDYCKTREVFGKPVIRHQANAHLIADLSSELEAAKVLAYHCADMINHGENAIKQVSMCKLFACETASKVIDRCLQLHGGYGYVEEYRIGRLYRDNRVNTIGGGASEVMREIISRMIIAGQ